MKSFYFGSFIRRAIIGFKEKRPLLEWQLPAGIKKFKNTNVTNTVNDQL
jgi:hypothetical protein